jgi:hypothetical protein
MTQEAYLQWLKQEEEKDAWNRTQGLSPLPRSREERLAIFYNLPPRERRRLRSTAQVWRDRTHPREGQD